MFIAKKIKYFMLAAEMLSFKLAAEKLYLSITPVSKGGHDLEYYLGYKLFYREINGIALTKEGVILYQTLRPIVDELIMVENRTKKAHKMSINIGIDGFYFYGMNELIKKICTELKISVNTIISNNVNLKNEYLNNNISILITNALTSDENIPGEKCIDLGSDTLKIAVSTEVFENIPDVEVLMQIMPLVQLSTTLRHPYYQRIHKYRESHNIDTAIFSMSEVPNVSIFVSEGIAMTFVSETVETGDHWKDGKTMLITPPIENLAVYRKLYYKSWFFKDDEKFKQLIQG